MMKFEFSGKEEGKTRETKAVPADLERELLKVEQLVSQEGTE